jgi:hypothetical protein
MSVLCVCVCVCMNALHARMYTLHTRMLHARMYTLHTRINPYMSRWLMSVLYVYVCLCVCMHL